MSIQEGSLRASKKIKTSGLLTTGFALFSMFFGAGNLIFPLLIGKSVGQNVWYAIGGLGVTAVAVPFLGLAAMILYRADYSHFFGRMGKVPGILLLLLLQLILGPFGVIPRLITLMHATASSYLSGMSIELFSILAAVLIFICSFKRQRLVSFLGAYLTPVLLISLGALLFFGLTGGSSFPPNVTSPKESFLQGLLGGYNTMDLIAAFLFAGVVLPHFEQKLEWQSPALRRQSVLKRLMISSLIAASLLFLTYVGLCLISAHHGWKLSSSCPSEQMLSAIAIKILGPAGGFIAASAITTACLTTAITLASIFADYLHKDLCRGKISPSLALILTLVATTLFANLGFSGIASFLGPILQVVYPGLILLTLLNLFHCLYGYRMVKTPVFLAFSAAGVFHLATHWW